MSTKFMTIVKKTFEEDYDAFRQCDYVQLCISDKHRSENYELHLNVNPECTAHNMDIIDGDTGEYLMAILIRPVIFPSNDRFKYDIVHVAEDFNHTRRYLDKDFAYSLVPMKLGE